MRLDNFVGRARAKAGNPAQLRPDGGQTLHISSNYLPMLLIPMGNCRVVIQTNTIVPVTAACQVLVLRNRVVQTAFERRRKIHFNLSTT